MEFCFLVRYRSEGASLSKQQKLQSKQKKLHLQKKSQNWQTQISEKLNSRNTSYSEVNETFVSEAG